MQYRITARLVAGSEAGALHGPDIRVRLFDRNFFEDDYLGEATPDAQGHLSFIIPASAMNHGVLEDKRPDFFFVVYRGADIIFQSKVMENMDAAALTDAGEAEAPTIDLGSFLIR